MCCNCIIKVFIKDNMASSMAPAANINGYEAGKIEEAIEEEI